MNDIKISLRPTPGNDNHHLWDNNGSGFWLHFVVHLPDYTKHRVRLPLQTKCQTEARRKRDLVFAWLEEPGFAVAVTPTDGRRVAELLTDRIRQLD